MKMKMIDLVALPDRRCALKRSPSGYLFDDDSPLIYHFVPPSTHHHYRYADSFKYSSCSRQPASRALEKPSFHSTTLAHPPPPHDATLTRLYGAIRRGAQQSWPEYTCRKNGCASARVLFLACFNSMYARNSASTAPVAKMPLGAAMVDAATHPPFDSQPYAATTRAARYWQHLRPFHDETVSGR